MAPSAPTTRPSWGTSNRPRTPPLMPMPRMAATRQGRVRVQAAHSAARRRRHLAWAEPPGRPMLARTRIATTDRPALVLASSWSGSSFRWVRMACRSAWLSGFIDPLGRSSSSKGQGRGLAIGVLLICAGTPGQQRVRVDGDLLLAAGRMDGAEPGSTVERPQRSEDERPGRRRGPSQDQHSEGRIPGQRIGTTSEQATGGAAMAGVRGRPALSWSAGRWPGDVMIDGVSHRVRPLVLSGPASVAWRQEHCGSWPRRISGVGRARTSRIGQATRPRSGVSDGGA